jgi:hypothetical protein
MEKNTFDVAWLSGSKILVGNAELRIPVTGPERYALIKSKYFLTEASLFSIQVLPGTAKTISASTWIPFQQPTIPTDTLFSARGYHSELMYLAIWS